MKILTLHQRTFMSCQASIYPRFIAYFVAREMGRTRSRVSTKPAGKRMRSKGSSRQATTVTMGAKLDSTIKHFDKEFELCKTFIAKHLKVREIVDGQVRRVITTRERMFRLFEKWRDDLDDTRTQLVAQLRALGDDHDPNEFADREKEIADLNEEIEQIATHDAEAQWRTRLIKTILKDVERSLQTHRLEHETIHSRLCQKLAFIGRSRECAIAQRNGLGTTKKGEKRI